MRTTPARLITLHLSQIGLTLALTFIVKSSFRFSSSYASLIQQSHRDDASSSYRQAVSLYRGQLQQG